MAVRPGLTGPWQVSGRNNISYEERVRIDRSYAISHALGLDMTILARTVLVALTAMLLLNGWRDARERRQARGKLTSR